MVAVGRQDGRTQLFDRASGEALGDPLAANASAVNDVSFSRDGSLLVSAGLDRTGAVWSLDGTRAIGIPLTGQTGPLTAAVFGPSVLATAGTDGTVALRSPTTARVTRLLRFGGEVRTVAIDAETGRIAAGGTATRSRSGGRPAVRPGGFRSATGGFIAWRSGPMVACSPSGSTDRRATSRLRAARASEQSASWIRARDAARHRPSSWSTGRRSRSRGAAMAGRSPLPTPEIWCICTTGARTASCRAPLESVDAPIADVTFDPPGRRVVGATTSGVTRQWDVATGKEIPPPFEGQVGPAFGVAFDRSGQTLATTTLGLSTTQLWDPSTARPIGGSLVGGRVPYTSRTANIDRVASHPSVVLARRTAAGHRRLRRRLDPVGRRARPLARRRLRGSRAGT